MLVLPEPRALWMARLYARAANRAAYAMGFDGYKWWGAARCFEEVPPRA